MAKLSFEESELSSLDLSDLNNFEMGILDDWYQKFKYYKCYPAVGRVSVPPVDLKLTKEELKYFKGDHIFKPTTTKTTTSATTTSAATSATESTTLSSTTSTDSNSHNTTATNKTESPAVPKFLPEALQTKLLTQSQIHPSYLSKLDPPLYLSINNKILDVSYGGLDMYGPGSGYHIFTGIDCSKSLSKMKFDEIYWNDTDMTDLSAEEIKILNDWDKKLCSKYPIVGTLI